MIVKTYKNKIPKKYFKYLPEIFWEGMPEATDPMNFYMCFFDKSEFIGAAKLNYIDPILKDDLPSWTLEVEFFEVNKNKIKTGCGRKMYEYMELRYPVHLVKLMYYDDNAKNFWKHMGFHLVTGKNMEKKIK